MKYNIFIFAFLLATNVYGQCTEFDKLIEKGNGYLNDKVPNYEEALNAYAAAILACSKRADEAQQRITIMGDNIKKLKKNALADRNESIELKQKNKESIAKLDRALDKINTANLTTLKSFAESGIKLIHSLDYADALEKIKLALDLDIDINTKGMYLTAPLEELLYFFAEGGRRPELAQTAASSLLHLAPSGPLAQALQKSVRENWGRREQFIPLIQELSSFEVLKARYYPEMKTIPLDENAVFTMGNPEWESVELSDEFPHEVQLSSPYQLASTPVTFYQFALYSEATNKSIGSRTPSWGRFGDHPVVNVNWYDAVEYANWLNTQHGYPPVYDMIKEKNSDYNNRVRNDFQKWKVTWHKNRKGYRLPTEAEWELAGRGGIGPNRYKYAGSNNLDEVGWFWKNSGDKPLTGEKDLNKIKNNNARTHAVRSKPDNGLGIYDMSGNVFEWCWDWYSSGYYKEGHANGLTIDPSGPEISSLGRVSRGGSWITEEKFCRLAYRNPVNADKISEAMGFRLVFITP